MISFLLYVHSWACRRRCRCKCSNTRTHTRSNMRAYTPRLIMKFHSSPVWKFFLIKFHLLQLGFHQPITGWRAEALIHAWFHQAPGEYQSMPPILLLFLSLHLLLLASLLPSPSRTSILTPDLTSSLPSLKSFYSPKISSFLPFSSCSHPSLGIAVSCQTHCLARQNDNSPERRLQHPRHSTMTEHHWPTASYGLQSTFEIWKKV